MNNKKIVITIITLLLISVVGISYSYFVASTTRNNLTDSTIGTTVNIDNTTFTVEGKLSINDLNIYPGHKNVSSIKVTATGDHTINYNLVWDGVNSLERLDYKVYKTTTEIIPTTICNRLADANNGLTKYYEECNIANIDSLGEVISSGSINKNTEITKEILKSNETITATPDGTVVYYYVVLEFPNKDEDQNIDMNSKFEGIVTVESKEVEYEKTKVTFTPSSVKGSNNWYKSVDITGIITGRGDTFTGKYCIGNTICIPVTNLTITDKTFNVSIPSEAYPQVLCVSIKDKYENATSECTESYNVDGEKPTGSVSITSSTIGTNNWYKALTLKIEGKDDHSKVISIKHCTTTSTNCTPNTTVNGTSTNIKLSSNESAQKVCYQIIDEAGNISTTICSASYKVDTTPPIVSFVSNSSTSNSITINVTGNDSHSKIDKYYYKIGNGSYEESTSTSKTFSNLSVGTSYTVYVYAVDKAGHQSAVISKEISTGIGVSNILAKYTKNTSRIGEVTAGFKESTPTTVYAKPDSDGTSYVFAGVDPNNWVKMGNIYFRIIRFNGNGSMRLIYSGTGSAQTSGTRTQISTGAFNSSYNDNAYVGLRYTEGQVHGTGTNSTILGETTSAYITLYGWYNSNIKNTYGSLIDSNVGFCSDRDNYTNTSGTVSGGGTGTTTTYYGPYVRYLKEKTLQTSYTPTLKCKSGTDLLKLPVGLITADEYILAGGGIYNTDRSHYNTTFWLHTGEHYWTMSPSNYDYSSARVIMVELSGCLSGYGVNNAIGIRPVINLKSSTTFLSGDYNGSAEKPWTVEIGD